MTHVARLRQIRSRSPNTATILESAVYSQTRLGYPTSYPILQWPVGLNNDGSLRHASTRRCGQILCRISPESVRTHDKQDLGPVQVFLAGRRAFSCCGFDTREIWMQLSVLATFTDVTASS